MIPSKRHTFLQEPASPVVAPQELVHLYMSFVKKGWQPTQDRTEQKELAVGETYDILPLIGDYSDAALDSYFKKHKDVKLSVTISDQNAGRRVMYPFECEDVIDKKDHQDERDDISYGHLETEDRIEFRGLHLTNGHVRLKGVPSIHINGEPCPIPHNELVFTYADFSPLLDDLKDISHLQVPAD